MMVLRQYSTVFCSSSKQAVCVAQLAPGDLTEQRSHWSIFVIFDEHMHVCVYVRGAWRWNYRQINAPIHMHLLMKLFEKHRGHGEDDPWRWHHHSLESRTTNASFFLLKQRLFVYSTFFSFRICPVSWKMWRHSTLTFVSLVTDSLYVGLQRIGGRAEAESRLFGVEWWWHERLK